MYFTADAKSGIFISWIIWTFFFMAVFITRYFFGLRDVLSGNHLFFIWLGGLGITIFVRFIIWMFRHQKLKWVLSAGLNLAIILAFLYGITKSNLNEFQLDPASEFPQEQERTITENGQEKNLTIRMSVDKVKIRHDWFMIYLLILGIVYTVTALLDLNEQKLVQMELKEKLSTAQLNALKETRQAHLNGTIFSKKLSVPLGKKIYFIDIPNIAYVVADGNYVNIFADGQKHVLRESLNSIEKKLEANTFIRIHKSFIINLEFIKEIRKSSNGSYQVSMTDNHVLNISKTYRNALFQQLKL